MWPDDYTKIWIEHSKDHLEKQWNVKNPIYEQLIKNSKNDKLKTREETEKYQQILSKDIFNDLDEATQAKIRLLLGDVYIIPKDKV